MSKEETLERNSRGYLKDVFNQGFFPGIPPPPNKLQEPSLFRSLSSASVYIGYSYLAC